MSKSKKKQHIKNLNKSMGGVGDMVATEKKKRTFTDLIIEGFAKEEDLVLLRNILIDKDIAVIGDKYTGLPLLIAIICDVIREEIGKSPYSIYATDYDYGRKLSYAKSKSLNRVIFQQINSVYLLDDAYDVAKKSPIVACIDPEMHIDKSDLEHFDYIIEMSFGTSAKIVGIYDAKGYSLK